MSRREALPSWSGIGEGEQRWFLGTLATIRIPGEAVAGRFALIEFLFPGGASPPLHTHPQDESYVVLEGQLTIQAAEERFELSSGGASVVPMGVAHTFRVDSDTARVLVLSTPAGLERMIRDGSVPAEAPTLPPAEAGRPGPRSCRRYSAGMARLTLAHPWVHPAVESSGRCPPPWRAGGVLARWRLDCRYRVEAELPLHS